MTTSTNNSTIGSVSILQETYLVINVTSGPVVFTDANGTSIVLQGTGSITTNAETASMLALANAGFINIIPQGQQLTDVPLTSVPESTTVQGGYNSGNLSMVGATNTTAGTSGNVPIPPVGSQLLPLLGSGQYASAIANIKAWNNANPYQQGDVVKYTDGNVYVANGFIPAGSTWKTASSGPTWQTLLSAGSIPNPLRVEQLTLLDSEGNDAAYLTYNSSEQAVVISVRNIETETIDPVIQFGWT